MNFTIHKYRLVVRNTDTTETKILEFECCNTSEAMIKAEEFHAGWILVEFKDLGQSYTGALLS